MTKLTFTYLFDPLCGWCYGAAPAIARLRGMADVALKVLPVGLFAWENAVPLDRMRDHIRPADARIASLTGQTFSETYFDRVIGQADGRVQSGPATQALWLAEQAKPGAALDLLSAIQRTRYVDGRDITDAAVLAELGNLDVAAVTDLRTEAAARTWAGQGAQMLSAVGARGVPTLLMHDAAGRTGVVPSNYLYQDRDKLEQLLLAA